MVIVEKNEYKKNMGISIIQNDDKKDDKKDETSKWNIVKHNKKKEKSNNLSNDDDNDNYDYINNNELTDQIVLKYRHKFYAAQYTSPDPSKLPIPKFYQNKKYTLSPQQMK